MTNIPASLTSAAANAMFDALSGGRTPSSHERLLYTQKSLEFSALFDLLQLRAFELVHNLYKSRIEEAGFDVDDNIGTHAYAVESTLVVSCYRHKVYSGQPDTEKVRAAFDVFFGNAERMRKAAETCAHLQALETSRKVAEENFLFVDGFVLFERDSVRVRVDSVLSKNSDEMRKRIAQKLRAIADDLDA